MAKFKKLITTNQGKDIINSSLSSSNYITFTKIKSSTNIYSDAEISELTDITNIKQTVNVTKTSKVDDTSILIEATINNTDLTEAYTLGSIGLYASYNNTEKLFAVASVESIDKGSYVPVYNEKIPTGIYIKLLVTIDCVNNITYNIDPTGYATLGDIARLENEISQLIGFEPEIVTSLPTTGEKGILYLISNEDSTEEENIYDEYIWIPSNEDYEKIGSTKIDISGKEDKSNKTNTINENSTNDQYPSAKGVYDYIQSLDASEVSY